MRPINAIHKLKPATSVADFGRYRYSQASEHQAAVRASLQIDLSGGRCIELAGRAPAHPCNVAYKIQATTHLHSLKLLWISN